METLEIGAVALRLVLALVCGAVLGMDRERNRRPAGFRTYTLVCVGSAMVMMTSQYVLATTGNGDVMRMGAQVISGIGFLGAGTIIVTGHRQVRGLTTAAGLWAVACIGLAIGSGFYVGAILCTLLILSVFTWFHLLGDRIHRRAHVLNLVAELDNVVALVGLLHAARENHLSVSDVEIEKSMVEGGPAAVLMSVYYHGQNQTGVLHILGSVPGVRHIEEY